MWKIFKVAHLVKNFDKIAHTKKVFEKFRIILIKTRLVIVILIKKTLQLETSNFTKKVKS
jgi:hypothetical protein